jgi:hypothetical protein
MVEWLSQLERSMTNPSRSPLLPLPARAFIASAVGDRMHAGFRRGSSRDFDRNPF